MTDAEKALLESAVGALVQEIVKLVTAAATGAKSTDDALAQLDAMRAQLSDNLTTAEQALNNKFPNG